MLRSLVGSEMCIRDRPNTIHCGRSSNMGSSLKFQRFLHSVNSSLRIEEERIKNLIFLLENGRFQAAVLSQLRNPLKTPPFSIPLSSLLISRRRLFSSSSGFITQLRPAQIAQRRPRYHRPHQRGRVPVDFSGFINLLVENSVSIRWYSDALSLAEIVL